MSKSKVQISQDEQRLLLGRGSKDHRVHCNKVHARIDGVANSL